VNFIGVTGFLRVLQSFTEGFSMSNEQRRDASESGMPLHTKIFIGLLVGIVAGLAANALGSKQQ
jgi:hypothetical protein